MAFFGASFFFAVPPPNQPIPQFDMFADVVERCSKAPFASHTALSAIAPSHSRSVGKYVPVVVKTERTSVCWGMDRVAWKRTNVKSDGQICESLGTKDHSIRDDRDLSEVLSRLPGDVFIAPLQSTLFHRSNVASDVA